MQISLPSRSVSGSVRPMPAFSPKCLTPRCTVKQAMITPLHTNRVGQIQSALKPQTRLSLIACSAKKPDNINDPGSDSDSDHEIDLTEVDH